MKKIITLAMLFISFNLFAQNNSDGDKTNEYIDGPRFEIEGGFTYDWGNVKPEDSPLKAKVKIMNTGNQLLEIKEVKPGCGCTTAPLQNDKIKPGEHTYLDVTLKMSNYSGNVRKTILIRSNDPTKARSVLTLKCNVQRPYKIFPRFLSFNRMYLNEVNSSRVNISNKTNKPMTITNLDFKPEGLKLNIKEGDVIPANETITIEASYTPTTVAPFSGVVKIEVDNAEVSEPIAIRVWGRIIGEKPEDKSKK